jgi:drug/metabolite transporter (DMT)-like permease
MNQKTKAYIALGTVCIAWGTTYLAMRTGVEHMPGLMLAAIRNTVCGVLVVGWFLAKGHRLPDGKTLGRLAVVSALLLGVGNGLMTWGEQTVPSGLAAVLAALNPLCIAFFSLLLMKGTKINFTVIAGLVLGLMGIVTVFFPMMLHSEQKGFGFGVALILLAVLGWSSGSVLISRKAFDLNVFYASGWQFLLGGLELIIFSVLTGHTIPLAKVNLVSWVSIGYLVMMGSLIGFNAFQYALKHLPATQVSIYAYINPIVALLLGWALLGEHLNLYIFIGSAITLVGVYLVQLSFRRAKNKMMRPVKNKSRLLNMHYARKHLLFFKSYK